MTKSGASTLVFFLSALSFIGASVSPSLALEEGIPHVCRPNLGASPAIELGKAGAFTWSCPGEDEKSKSFYVVFIRPSGTYVLLKVPRGRESFEFTPDTPGTWRWIVINTDPDRTKPDVESMPGHFQVVRTQEPTH